MVHLSAFPWCERSKEIGMSYIIADTVDHRVKVVGSVLVASPTQHGGRFAASVGEDIASRAKRVCPSKKLSCPEGGR